MKTSDKQIMSMLQAFNQKDVLKAFDLYQQGIKNEFQETIKQLKEGGWEPFDEKPKDKEFYFFQEKYWVQNEEAREKEKQKFIEEHAKKQKEQKKKYTGQKMDLELSQLKCPKCNSGMYKQSICQGCKEGKQGFKLRLICEENPDHEILL